MILTQMQTSLSGRDDLQILNDPSGTHEALMGILENTLQKVKCEACNQELNFIEGHADSIFMHYTHEDGSLDGYCGHDINKQEMSRSWTRHAAGRTAAAVIESDGSNDADESEIKLLKDATPQDLINLRIGVGNTLAQKIYAVMQTDNPPTSWSQLVQVVPRFGPGRARDLAGAGYTFGT